MVKSEKQHTKPTKTTVRVGKFAIIGAILTVVNYLLYTFLSQVIIKDNNLLPLASFISTFFITFLAYFLHSKITWKERHPNRTSIIKFFIWNFLLAIIICPFLTWLFSNMKLFYELAFNISNTINLQFEYDFIESTGAFCFTTAVTMILNYLFYDKFVFGSQDVVQTHIYNNNLKSIKVSIIVPIYNTEKYLTDCIDSIIKQTHDNLEIILVDDGSTDNSGKIADKYAKKDKRIKVIHQKNQGQSAARNLGLKKSTGNYISFIDADDKIEPSFIADLLAPFADDSIALSVCGIHYKRLKSHSAEDVYISPLRTRRPKEDFKSYILYLLAVDGRMYSSVNKLYRADIARKLAFDVKLNFAEDTKFVLDYLNKVKESELAFVLKPLYIYNFGTETSTMRSVSTNWHNWQISYTNLKSWLGPNPSMKSRFWLHMVYLRWRVSHLRSKRRAKQ